MIIIGLVLSLVFTAVLAAVAILLYKRVNELKGRPEFQLPAPVVNINLKQIEGMINDVPNKVLQSIQSSTNGKKGALGELIGYIELKAEYDRIVPLGSIVDFVGIKLPTETEAGRLDFIDVKTGKNARLTKDQKDLQKLIEEKKINFITIKIDVEDRQDV